MMNKKIFFSILIITFASIGIVGTYASIANTAPATPTVTATAMEKPIIYLSDGTSGGLHTMTIPNILPGDSGATEIITIVNAGPVGSTATLTATVDTLDSGSDISKWMQLWVPGPTGTPSTYFYDKGSAGTINLGTISGGYGVLQLPMHYTFVNSGDDGEQNAAAGQSFKYAITFTLTASH